jgi:uncharacterized membrane protein (DUF485 family)
MKRHIKAFLITIAILAAFVGLTLLAAFYPEFMINGILITSMIAVCVALYMIVLLNIKKEDNEKIH